jgi:hypothetical protein
MCIDMMFKEKLNLYIIVYYHSETAIAEEKEYNEFPNS